MAKSNKHRVNLDDLAQLKRADDLQLSPAGDLLAYVTGDGDLWLITTVPGSTPKKLGEGVLPKWSPDGTHLAYYSSVSETFQLWSLDIESGAQEQLTHIEGGINPDPYTRLVGWTHDPLSYAWSPDGSKLVFPSRVISNQTRSSTDAPNGSENTLPLVLTTSSPPEWTLRGVFRAGGFGVPEFVHGRIDWSTDATTMRPPSVNQLFTVDVHTGRVEQITKDEGVYFNANWSPDGRTIVCASSDGEALLGDGPGRISLYAFDVTSGKKTLLTHDRGDKRLPVWSADGKWIAYLGGEHFGTQSVFVVPVRGGVARNLTLALDRHVMDFQWGPESKSVIVAYQDGVSWPIDQIELKTGRLQTIVGNTAAIRRDLTVSLSGAVAWQQSDGTHEGLICILRPQNKRVTQLVDLNPQVADWELGPQEVVHWKNGRGEHNEGILIKPVDYRAGMSYPLIVDAYPGQGNSFKGYAMIGNQAWASKGYGIFWPNARAPHDWVNSFKSKAHDHAGRGPRGLEVMVDDVLSGVDALIRRHQVDPKRMGLYGFSNGGGVVNQLVTRTNRFRCAVSVGAAISADWSREFFLHTLNPIVPRIVGALPWQNPEAYVTLSAIYHLDRVKTPMLLADGDNDGDFLLGTIEMYNGLRYLGRDVTLLRYPNQGHGFTGAAMADFWERETRFLDEHLGPTTVPQAPRSGRKKRNHSPS